MTLLTVPVTNSPTGEIIGEIERLSRLGADAVELRLDHLRAMDLAGVVRQSPLPLIVTCRREDEGGKQPVDDPTRIRWWRDALRAGAEFIDVEWRSWRENPDIRRELEPLLKKNKTRLILSYHDFSGCPKDPARLTAQIADEPAADIVKIVWKPTDIRDNLICFDLLGDRQRLTGGKPLIALCMGEAGLISRILAKKMDAFLTFASPDQGAESAPGQVTLARMKDLYRWDALNAETELYGVIGCPVGHSLSPTIHNPAFAEIRYNAVYLPFLVPAQPEVFDEFVDGLSSRARICFRGASVTIPHKKNALDFVRARGGPIEPLAETIGAANTLVVSPNGPPEAYNTDYSAAREALTRAMGIKIKDLAGIRIAVLGAGGVARAVVAALTDAGANVTIYNRTASRAHALAETFHCRTAPWEQREKLSEPLDNISLIIVNCTSIGMHPNVDASPLSPDAFNARQIVFDTVYNPINTLLIKTARKHKCITVDGVSMFVNQAADQFSRWTAYAAPLCTMRMALLKQLTPI